MIDGERPGLGATSLGVLDLDALIVPKIEMPALLARAFRASPKLWSLVEVLDGDLELVDGHPGFARFFGDGRAAALRRASELRLPKELLEIWLDCCLESWRVLETTSCRVIDPSTEPPRRLEITATPLLEDRERTCCLCFFDEIAPAAGRRLAADIEEPFRQVADTLPVLIWTAGPEGERDFFNRPWLELVGRSLERSLGEGWLELVHADDREMVRELWQDAYGGHESFNAEYRLRRHDGVYRFVLDRGTPRFRSDGRFLGFAGSCIDITERRRAEEQLQLSERYYRELIEGTDNLVTQVDADGRLSFINPVCREVYGLEPEECIGFPFLDFVHPDDRDATRRHFDRWARGGVNCMSFENRQVSRTGEVRDMLWTVNPHYDDKGPDDKGPLISINAIGQDITERKRSERVHKIQSQVLESMTEGVTLTNPAGFILYTNPAQDLMFGYEPGELIGQHFSLLSGDPIGASAEELERKLTSAGSWVGEFRHRKKNGSPFFTSARISLLEIDHTAYRVAVIEDISEQKKAEEERRALDTRIRQAQKLESLGVLAGGIAHDFNNLLMVVLGNASLALQDLDPGSPLHHDIEQIETAAMRASELTKQMLAYSGKGHFVIEPTDLSAVVANMEQLLRSSVSRTVAFELALARDLPLVDADVSQLRQVVMNLVSNAAEALGRDSGSLMVRTGCLEASRALLDSLVVVDDLPEGEYVFLEVRDSGAGMDDAVLARVFDPFFTTKFTGRGLGLAAVLGIVRGHRGGIRIESQPGIGTTATVLLPPASLKKEAAAAVLAPAREASDEDLDAEGTVLLVDDEEGVRSMAHRMLERLGFRVLTAVDGIEAVEAFRRHHDEIRLVLLDMTMPRMDGVEAFRALRAIRPDVKVILTSGYSEQMAAEQVGENGPAAFLQKPYRPADLVHKIDDVLDQTD